MPTFPPPPPPPPTADDYGELSLTDARRGEELEALLQGLGTDTRVQIYNEGKYAGVMPADSVSLESIFDQYGGGEKTLIIFQGRRKVESMKVSFDPGIPPTSPAQKKREREAAEKQAGGGGTRDILDQLAAQSMQQSQTMMTMMTGFASAMAAMVGAMKPASDPTESAVRIVSLLKDNGNGGGNVLETLKFGIDLASKMGGKDDDGTMGAVRDGLAIVGKAVDAYAADKARGAAPADARILPTPPVPVPNVPHDPDMPTARPTDRPWIREAAPHVDTLVSMRNFLTPETAAAALDGKMTDDGFDDLLQDIMDPTPPGFAFRLLQRFPQLGELGNDYLQSLMEQLAMYGEDDDAPAAAPSATSAPAGAS